MGIRDYYPEGTDLSYFDGGDREQDETCPNCGVVSTQYVTFTEKYRNKYCDMDAVCEECDHEWHKEWVEEWGDV